MDLSTAQQILVVVLATALALFLVLSVVAMILIIRLVQTLRAVADKAERIVASAEMVGDIFKKASGPLNIFRFVRGVSDIVSQHKQDNDKKE